MTSERQKLPFTEAVEVNPKINLEKGIRYPFIDMKAVDPLWRGVMESEQRAFKGGGARFEPYDTLLARITPCLENGKIAQYIPAEGSEGPAFGSTEFIVIRGKDGLTDNSFAYYLTNWQDFRQFAVSQMTGSSGRQRVPVGSLSSFYVPVPPLPEQRAIAHILGTLDDKIELNRRMNETLAAMAQTVFKSWFINFDPVIDNALAAGNPIPEAIQPRAEIRRSILNGTAERNGYEKLSDTIRQRFPSAFEYTEEIGYIPKGWKVGVLDDMIELLSGGTPRTSVAQYWDGNIPWYTAKDAPSLSDIFVIETERKITQSGVENSATKILPAGTTIITARGTVGRLACLGIPMAMNQTCYGIRGTDSYPDYFTYLNIRMTVDELQQRTHGTIFDTITRHTFQLVDTIIPPPKLADTFETVVQPIMNRILSNLQESRTLAAVRDTLLPKLIAGDLQLSNLRRQWNE